MSSTFRLRPSTGADFDMGSTTLQGPCPVRQANIQGRCVPMHQGSWPECGTTCLHAEKLTDVKQANYGSHAKIIPWTEEV
jgi:hypothetical protein